MAPEDKTTVTAAGNKSYCMTYEYAKSKYGAVSALSDDGESFRVIVDSKTSIWEKNTKECGTDEKLFFNKYLKDQQEKKKSENASTTAKKQETPTAVIPGESAPVNPATEQVPQPENWFIKQYNRIKHSINSNFIGLKYAIKGLGDYLSDANESAIKSGQDAVKGALLCNNRLPEETQEQCAKREMEYLRTKKDEASENNTNLQIKRNPIINHLLKNEGTLIAPPVSDNY